MLLRLITFCPSMVTLDSSTLTSGGIEIQNLDLQTNAAASYPDCRNGNSNAPSRPISFL